MCVCFYQAVSYMFLYISVRYIYLYVSRMMIIAVTIEINTMELTVCNWDSIRYESGPFG